MHITVSTAQNNGKRRKLLMSEKLYKIVSGVGAGSIALGIITLVTGVTTGVLMIVNGARLLKGKSDMMI